MGGGGPKNTTTTVVPMLPEWAKPYWTGLAQQGRREAGTPYRRYGGQRVAGFDPMETQAFGQAQSLGQSGPRPELGYAFGQMQRAGRTGSRPSSWLASQAGPSQELEQSFGQAQQAAQTGASPADWGIGAYRKYANPYLEQVMAPGRERIMENYRDMLPKELGAVRMRAGDSGIMGGRANLEMAGVAKGIADQTARNLREFETGSRFQAYDEARKAALDFGALGQEGARTQLAAAQQMSNVGDLKMRHALDYEASRQAGGRLQLDAASQAAELAGLQQNQALQRIAAMQEAGIARRDMEQSIRDMAYQDFLEKRGWDRERLNWLAGLLSGTPYSQTGKSSATTQHIPGASPISQGAGLGLAGIGAYNMFKPT